MYTHILIPVSTQKSPVSRKKKHKTGLGEKPEFSYVGPSKDALQIPQLE
jgi:hypothetical protein